MKARSQVKGDRSLSQVLKILEAAQSEDPSISRLLKILAAAQLEIQDLEADFQVRLQQAVQEAEVKFKERLAEEREQETKEAEEAVRRAVTQELLARFDAEFQRLNDEFEERRLNAISATEETARVRSEQALAEAARVREELKAQFQAAAGEWEADRQELNKEITKLQEELARTSVATHPDMEGSEQSEARLSELNRERALLQEEFQEAATRWNSERDSLKAEIDRSRQELLTRFDGEIERLKADFEERRQKAIIAAEANAEMRFDQARNEIKEDYQRREQEIQSEASQWFQSASNQWEAERNELTQQIAKLEEEFSKAQEIAEQGIRTPLSRELEAKLEEASAEKVRLEQEFQTASAQWTAERERLESDLKGMRQTGSGDVSDAVRAEIARIESLLDDMSKRIDDPGIDLSSTIRINRQRTELEAYLKGLRYSVGEISFGNS